MYYAVKIGRKIGIYQDASQSRAQTHGYKGAIVKKCRTLEEAEACLNSSVLHECNHAIAYIDGSFSQVINKYSYGIVLLYNGTEIHLSGSENKKELLPLRNVAGEILAAMKIIDYAKNHGITKLTIVHDYDGIPKLFLGRCRKPTRFAQELSAMYKKTAKNVNIQFSKVKGHSGHWYNNLADALARDAIGLKISQKAARHINIIEKGMK